MANYNEKQLPDLSALAKVIEKLEGDIKSEGAKLSNYLEKSEAETTYAKKADISSIYKPKGSVDDLAGLAELNVEGNVGNVYNVKAAFTTDETFLEGTGKSYPAGTNVVVVEDQGAYKFDALSGAVDLTNYVDNDGLTSKLTNYVDTNKLTTELAKKADKTALDDYVKTEVADGEQGYIKKSQIASAEEIEAFIAEVFPGQ